MELDAPCSACSSLGICTFDTVTKLAANGSVRFLSCRYALIVLYADDNGQGALLGP